jgi:hypothetical protein
MTNDLIEAHVRRFTWRAQNIYGVADQANASPLYAELSTQIANDPEILQLVIRADSHTTVANLLFGAVHFLLLGGVQHPLAAFYPSLVDDPSLVAEAYPHFRAFCLEYAAEIEQIITTRTVQTNEVQRCTGLLPAFAYLAQRGNNAPLHLLEVGASLGLLLLWDSYNYHYPSVGQLSANSPVQLMCEVRGQYLPPIPLHFPVVTSRIGIELHPVDLADEAATRWVQALIWPEHRERAHLFQQALALARRNPPPIIAGDMVAQLPSVLADLPPDGIICLYHSYTLNQCPKAVGAAVHDLLLAHSQRQPLYRISLEWYSGQQQPHLELFTYHAGKVEQELLAYCESHGRWIEWLAEAHVT